MPITESGITLDFPDNNFFRFQDCQGYRDIQQNFKEMDVCWYDQENDILYIIELKDWGDGTLVEEMNPSYNVPMIDELKSKITNSRINLLLKKAVDSTCMFLSILLNKPYSANIAICSPFQINVNTSIKLLSIINWTSPDTTYIATVHGQFKTCYRPYARLFGIKTYVILTKEQAKSQYPWVS